MKKQFMSNLSNAVRKTTVRFGLASFLVLSLAPSLVHAQGNILPTDPVVIKYVGTLDDEPVFLIEFDNKNEELLTVSIKDDGGNILYVEKFNGKKFSKKFKYLTSDQPNVRLSFTLSGDKEKQTQVFAVNSNTRVIQDVVVTRL
jgi:hypothetical protein